MAAAFAFRSAPGLGPTSPVVWPPPLAVADASGRIWGTYLHGAFERDGFRRWFLDRLRERRGLAPLGESGSAYDLDAAYDRLADIVRDSMDMTTIYRLLGL